MTLGESFRLISDYLSFEFRKALNDLGYPKLSHFTNQFEEIFILYVKLQHPRTFSGIDQSLISEIPNNSPFSVLAEHYSISFKFHFSGNKKTNQLDKPEYYTAFVLESIKEQQGFLEDYLQNILIKNEISTVAIVRQY
jgi:hypothetical protein